MDHFDRLPEQGGIIYDFLYVYERYYPNESIIYHYTSPDGMLGILNHDKIKLRFSRITCLNDYSEGQEVIPLYQKVCNCLHAKGTIDDYFYNNVINIEPQLIRNFVDTNGDDLYCDNDVYVCCFSKQSDSLTMWNYYLHNNKYHGYCIGLSSNAFKNSRKLQHAIIELASVIYTDNKKEEIIQNELLSCYQDYIDQGDFLGGHERWISAMLAFWKYTFKNHHSENEQEIRALLFFPHSTSTEIERNFLTEDMIKYRYKEGIMIPYLEVEFESTIFCGIHMAPNTRLQEAKDYKDTIEYQMLDEFLRRNKYIADDMISISTVPARY